MEEQVEEIGFEVDELGADFVVGSGCGERLREERGEDCSGWNGRQAICQIVLTLVCLDLGPIFIFASFFILVMLPITLLFLIITIFIRFYLAIQRSV